MLPNSTIALINKQIETELRHMNSIFCDTQQDKMDTLERINKLQSMLTPQSSDASSKPEPQETIIDLNPLLDDLMSKFRKKR